MSFAILDGKGFHVSLPNGWTVSVQFGPGNYCEHYHGNLAWDAPQKSRKWESRQAEIAAWNSAGEWFKFPSGDTVEGYQDAASVLKFINKIANKKPVAAGAL
jgi:hypothetical protein